MKQFSILSKVFVIIIFSLISSSIIAQDSIRVKEYTIKLHDGRIFKTGHYSVTESHYTFKVSRKKFIVAKDKISSVDEASKMIVLKPAKQALNRLFYQETAFGLEKGETQYRNILLSLNAVDIGVTKYYTIGIGLDIYSSYLLKSPSIILSQKFHKQIFRGVHGSVGTNSIFIDGFSINYLNSILTLGNDRNNFSFGVNKRLNKRMLTNKINHLSLNGMARINSNMSFIADCTLINPANYATNLYMMGIRFHTLKGSVDLGVITNGIGNYLPTFGFSKSFNN